MSLDEVLKGAGVKKSSEMDLDSFIRIFTHDVPLNLDVPMLFKLFAAIDVNGDGVVTVAEFDVYFKEVTKPTKEEKKEKEEEKKRVEVNKEANEGLKKEFKEKAGDDSGNSEKAFEKYIAEISVTKSDYFRGNCTIFTDPIKALKAADNFVKEMKSKSQQFFLDPTFGPSKSDPFAADSLYFKDTDPRRKEESKDVVWLRPHQISKSKKPRFFDSKVLSSDVQQGSLGDCWFISAMSVIATKENYLRGNLQKILKTKSKDLTDDDVAEFLKGVYPPLFHYLQEFGLYVFRFFKTNQWLYVITDDLIPCEKDYPEPKFARSPHIDLFWVSLIEKAYGKLHTTYEAIVGGIIDDGLVDMTGLVSLKLKVNKNKQFDLKSHGSKENLWNKMLKHFREGSMMGCGIDARARGLGSEEKLENGLLSGHAYSIQGFYEIKVDRPNLEPRRQRSEALATEEPVGTPRVERALER